MLALQKIGGTGSVLRMWLEVCGIEKLSRLCRRPFGNLRSTSDGKGRAIGHAENFFRYRTQCQLLVGSSAMSSYDHQIDLLGLDDLL